MIAVGKFFGHTFQTKFRVGVIFFHVFFDFEDDVHVALPFFLDIGLAKEGEGIEQATLGH